MDTETIICLENISVCYDVPNEPIASFKEYAIRYLQGKVSSRKFLALSEINLEIHRGEALGIIGRNGAGKSTLLKVISRIILVNAGRLYVRGDVSPLMEVGAGFHPELTGKENIFLNGTLLGRTRREIQKKMDDILDFAEIADFINAPIRTYSSGMIARLGFAIATAWQPEILILDEVFAVGDIFFKRKCLLKMEAFHANGSTIIIVSHDGNLLSSICSKIAWLDQGKIQASGDAQEVLLNYEKSKQKQFS